MSPASFRVLGRRGLHSLRDGCLVTLSTDPGRRDQRLRAPDPPRLPPFFVPPDTLNVGCGFRREYFPGDRNDLTVLSSGISRIWHQYSSRTSSSISMTNE